MNVWDTLIKAWKLSPKYLLPIFVVAGILLFSPRSLLGSIGVVSLVADYRSWIGLALLLTGALLLSHLTSWFMEKAASRLHDWRFRRNGRKYLRQLSPDEKRVLSYFIAKDTKSHLLDIADGTTNVLVAKMVILRSAQLGNLVDGFAHTIQPWAWEALQKDSSVLEPELSELKERLSQSGRSGGW